MHNYMQAIYIAVLNMEIKEKPNMRMCIQQILRVEMGKEQCVFMLLKNYKLLNIGLWKMKQACESSGIKLFDKIQTYK